MRQVRWLWLYRPLVQQILDRADAIVVGSERTARDSPLFGRRRPIEVIPYGVDLAWFDPGEVTSEERLAVRERYGAASRPLILAVGRLVYYKGFDHLIAAAHGLSAEVVIAGHGPMLQELRAQATLAPNAHVVGALSPTDLRRHLAAADLFVLPSTSRAESFGLATVEAQAMGTAAVVADVGTGTTEAIQPGETGVVVAPRDPPALQAAVGELLSEPERLQAMGTAARERALVRFDARARASDVEQVYRRVIADGGRRAR